MNNEARIASRARSARSAIVAVALLAMMLSTDVLLAQNPSLVFASGIGSTGTEIGNDIASDDDGNLYIVGTFQGAVDVDPGPGVSTLTCSGSTSGEADVFVASYDASGSYRWAFRIGAKGENEGQEIAVDGNGAVTVIGWVNNACDFDPGPGTATRGTNGKTESFVARYSSAGAFVWAFTIGASKATALAVDDNGVVVVSGFFYGTVDFDPGKGKASLSSTKSGREFTADIFVARYSNTGTHLWAFRVGGTSRDEAYGVAIDAGGAISITGWFNGTVDFDPGSGVASRTSAGDADIFVARYTASGAYVWAHRIGGTGGDGAEGISVDSSGNVVVTGSFNGTVDVDPGAGVASLTAVGTVGTGDAFIASYSATGAYRWAFNPSPGYGRGCIIDGNGDVFVTGRYYGVNDFDPSTGGTASLPGSGCYIAKYSANGAYVWAISVEATSGSAQGFGIVAEGDSVSIAGIFSGTVDADPGDGTTTLTSAGSHDLLIASYSENTLLKTARERRTRVTDVVRSIPTIE